MRLSPPILCLILAVQNLLIRGVYLRTVFWLSPVLIQPLVVKMLTLHP